MDILFAWIACIASGFTPLVIKASSKSLVKNPWLFNIFYPENMPGFWKIIRPGYI